MQAPSAGFISAAAGELEKVSGELAGVIAEQQAELLLVYPDASLDFMQAYMLGLQTARVCLETHPLLGVKGIKAGDLL